MVIEVHRGLRPLRDPLSLRRDDGRALQFGKGEFRRIIGETAGLRVDPHSGAAVGARGPQWHEVPASPERRLLFGLILSE